MQPKKFVTVDFIIEENINLGILPMMWILTFFFVLYWYLYIFDLYGKKIYLSYHSMLKIS